MPAMVNAGKPTNKTSLADNTTVNNKNLIRVFALLEQAGFIVTFCPPELWQHRALLSAYNPETRDGYLIGPDELGMILHYGVEYFNPWSYSEPRYQDKSNPDRLKHYAEAVLARACADVASSQPGSRNSALYKAAFSIGRYLFGWQLDEDKARADLLDAALQSGLRGGANEARATIKSGFSDGQKLPRDPSDLELVRSQNKTPADKHLAKLERKLNGSR